MWNGRRRRIDLSVDLLIRAQDRPGMLADITSVISDTGSNIRTSAATRTICMPASTSPEITDRKHLERIMTNIRKIPGIFGVERLYKV